MRKAFEAITMELLASQLIIKIYSLKTQLRIKRERPEVPGGELLCLAHTSVKYNGAAGAVM